MKKRNLGLAEKYNSFALAYRGQAKEFVERLQRSGCSVRMIEVSSDDANALSDIKHEHFTKVIVNEDHGAEGKKPLLYWKPRRCASSGRREAGGIACGRLGDHIVLNTCWQGKHLVKYAGMMVGLGVRSISGFDGSMLEKFVFMDWWIKKGCPFRNMKHLWFQFLESSEVPTLKLLGQKTF